MFCSWKCYLRILKRYSPSFLTTYANNYKRNGSWKRWVCTQLPMSSVFLQGFPVIKYCQSRQLGSYLTRQYNILLHHYWVQCMPTCSILSLLKLTYRSVQRTDNIIHHSCYYDANKWTVSEMLSNNTLCYADGKLRSFKMNLTKLYLFNLAGTWSRLNWMTYCC